MDSRHVYRMRWSAAQNTLTVFACLFLFHASLLQVTIPALACIGGGLAALTVLKYVRRRVELDGEILRIYQPGYVRELRAVDVESWERLPTGWTFHTSRGGCVFLEDAFAFDGLFEDWLRRFPDRTAVVLT